MTDTIWTLAPDEAPERIEANMRSLWAFAGHGPDRTYHDDGHLTWVSSGSYAWPNLIFQPRLTGVDLDPYLAEVCGRIRAGQMPRLWVRGHDEGPPGLYERLVEHGFREVGRRPTLALDLTGFRAELEPLPGLAVAPVGSPADLDAWLSIVSGSFVGGRDMGRAVFAEHLLPSPRCRLYLARLGGEAVGTALMWCDAGVAGLHLVGVPESWRRRGIAARVTAHALREGAALGYKVATLKASPLGENIYRRLGFQDYSRLILYSLAP